MSNTRMDPDTKFGVFIGLLFLSGVVTTIGWSFLSSGYVKTAFGLVSIYVGLVGVPLIASPIYSVLREVVGSAFSYRNTVRDAKLKAEVAIIKAKCDLEIEKLRLEHEQLQAARKEVSRS